jgi:hypothetical protein
MHILCVHYLFQISWFIVGDKFSISGRRLEDDGYQKIHNLEVEGLCTCTHARWEFISVNTSTGDFLLLQGYWRLNIAGYESTPVLLALTELAIGIKLPYSVNRNLIYVPTEIHVDLMKQKFTQDSSSSIMTLIKI